MNKDAVLILEGGAMRSVFSAGIIDFLMDKSIHIPNVIAVSAGAYAGMNYVSGQRGRLKEAVIEPLRDYRYMGLSTFLKKGTFFDMDYLFDEVPKGRAPFDFERFRNSGMRFLTSTVDLESGETIYYEDFQDESSFFRICKAANSLPLIAKKSVIDGRTVLDGGMADAIPIAKAIEEGFQKAIVVFTRDASYRKKEKKDLYNRLIHFVYRKYPKFLELVDARAKCYNDSIEKISRMEQEGKAFVFRPTTVTVTNSEHNVDRLNEYYRHGYETAKLRYEELKEFLRR